MEKGRPEVSGRWAPFELGLALLDGARKGWDVEVPSSAPLGVAARVSQALGLRARPRKEGRPQGALGARRVPVRRLLEQKWREPEGAHTRALAGKFCPQGSDSEPPASSPLTDPEGCHFPSLLRAPKSKVAACLSVRPGTFVLVWFFWFWITPGKRSSRGSSWLSA